MKEAEAYWKRAIPHKDGQVGSTPILGTKNKKMLERFEKQLKHFGKNGVLYAFLSGNKRKIDYNGKIHLIENGLIELKFEDFHKYQIDIDKDFSTCVIPNIKLAT